MAQTVDRSLMAPSTPAGVRGPNVDQDSNDHLQVEGHQPPPEIIHPGLEANINHVVPDIPPEAAVPEPNNIQQIWNDPAIRDRVIIGETEEQVEMRGAIIMELGEAPPDRIDAFWMDPAIRALRARALRAHLQSRTTPFFEILAKTGRVLG